MLSHIAPSKDAKKLGASIAKGLAEHSAESREHKDHVREARRKGITWESEIPVSDKGSGRRR